MVQMKTFIKRIVIFGCALFWVFPITQGCHSNAGNNKNSNSKNTAGLVGIWVGTYQTDQWHHLPSYCSFIIYPNGTFLRSARSVGPSKEMVYYTGSWKLYGNVFSYVDTTINAKENLYSAGSFHYNSTDSLSDGTWNAITGSSYTGTFPVMVKLH